MSARRRMQIGPYLPIKSKCIDNHNIKPGTLHKKGQKLGNSLDPIDTDYFLNRALIAQELSSRVNKQILTMLKKVLKGKRHCHLKKKKQQPSEWGKDSTNSITAKGLLFKIHNKLTKLVIKKTKYSNFKKGYSSQQGILNRGNSNA